MKKVVRVITSKYFVVAICFVAWILYFDQNDWMTLHDRQVELNNVKDNIAYLKREITDMEQETKSLSVTISGKPNDPVKLEQYAREHFRMKHDSEDVYVIEQ